MASNVGALIDFEQSAPTISGPPATLRKDTFALPDLPTAFELDKLNSSAGQIGPSLATTPSGVQTPRTFNDAEESRPPSPDYGAGVNALQSLYNPPINKYRVLAACLMNFGNGLNDSGPGAIIPYMEKEYHIGYAIVSLIFVANAIGFISAAPLTNILQARFGRARSYAVGEIVLTAGYIILVCRPPSRW